MDRLFYGKKVVVVTPAGRRQYLDILFKYIVHLKPAMTEYRLWVNTINDQDIECMRKFQRDNEDFVTLEYLDAEEQKHFSATAKENSICKFYKNCCDPDTVYIRFDDDIVAMGDIDSFQDFIKFRIDNPQYFLVYANILNNALTSYLHQRNGLFDTAKGVCWYECLDRIGWKSGPFAEMVHSTILATPDLNVYKMKNWHLFHYERMSVNGVSWLGDEFAKFMGRVDKDEEDFIACAKPRELQKKNIVFGAFVCVHYAFYTQRPHLDKNPSLLKSYANLAEKLAS